MGAAIWAAYSIWAKGQNYTSSFMGPVMLISSLLCLIAHVMWEETAWPYTLAGGLVVFTLGAFRVSYVLWDIGMRRGDTLLLTSLSYCVPLASTLLMIAFGFKPEHPGIALGGALIVLGCLTVNADKLLKLFRQRLVPAA
ncbi:MAG: EamA family transporter [Alphaproteobacteria bacterium]|nr:EamA family transporter [Alphaproteobacteria bacterium]